MARGRVESYITLTDDNRDDLLVDVPSEIDTGAIQKVAQVTICDTNGSAYSPCHYVYATYYNQPIIGEHYYCHPWNPHNPGSACDLGSLAFAPPGDPCH